MSCRNEGIHKDTIRDACPAGAGDASLLCNRRRSLRGICEVLHILEEMEEELTHAG